MAYQSCYSLGKDVWWFLGKLNATYFPLNNNIGWLSKCMEEIWKWIVPLSRDIKNTEPDDKKPEKALLVPCSRWTRKMLILVFQKVLIYFHTSTKPPKRQVKDYKQAFHGRQSISKFQIWFYFHILLIFRIYLFQVKKKNLRKRGLQQASTDTWSMSIESESQVLISTLLCWSTLTSEGMYDTLPCRSTLTS